VRGDPADIGAIEVDLAAIRRIKTGDHVDGGRLAEPLGPDQSNISPGVTWKLKPSSA